MTEIAHYSYVTREEKDALSGLGTIVKAWRIYKNMKQRELAVLIRKRREYISRLENGRVNPDILTLVKIAQALELTISEFFKSPPKNLYKRVL